ncbi:VWA domain-containing protein [Candidatus Poribacteria bacterium]|nr:VWA domain-containing protein [Candidatus Poribacteria bacterium]
MIPRISNYWAMLLLLLIPYTYYLTRKSLADLPKWRNWAAFVLRSVIILILTLSLAGLKITWRKQQICVMFLVDRSRSVDPMEIQRAEEYIIKTSESMTEDDMIGVITFAGEPNIQIPPEKISRVQIGELEDPYKPEYTNLSSAIKTSAYVMPGASQKKIVIMSDGNENVDKSIKQARIARTGDIQIYSLPMKTAVQDKPEVMVESLMGPDSIASGQVFSLDAVIRSNIDAKAVVKLLKDKNYVDERRVDLSRNKKHVVEFSQYLETQGTHIYEVYITPSDDTLQENNEGKALVLVTGRPGLLYIAGDNLNRDYLREVLVNQGFEIRDGSVPISLDQMREYGAVILNDVPASEFSDQKMKVLESYVHDMTGGLIMVGGEDSFGIGGYSETPVEKALPVKVIPEQEKRSLSIVLGIDSSGSMAEPSGGYRKISLAKEAAIAVVDFLKEEDQLGIVAFDAKVKPVVRLGKVESKAFIEDSIAAIQPGGGTNIYPALRTAYNWFQNTDTQLKHMVLVSDGKSQQQQDPFPLALQMARDNITLSTVAIGQNADIETMRELARIGQGRFYQTNQAGDLPRIFIRETFEASEFINEGLFTPVKTQDSPVISGVDVESMPSIYGYMGTSAKDGASVIISTETGDPLLAAWQYGLGRSVAFTSDTRARWAANMLMWEDYAKFWSQVINWCVSENAGDFQISVGMSEDEGTITVDAVDSQGQFRNFLDFQARVVLPDFTSSEISLEQIGSGRYQASFSTRQTGTYIITISEIREGKPIASRTIGLVAAYSSEYSDLEVNTALLQELSNITGGKFNPEPSELVIRGEAKTWGMRELWRILALISLPLFLIDVALRRITISRQQIQELKQKLMPQPAKEAPVTATLTQLKQSKTAVWQRDEPKPVRKNTVISPSKEEEKAQSGYTSRLMKAKKRAGK